MDIELVISRDCNLDCKYCFEGKKSKDKMPLIYINQIIEFIDSYLKENFIYTKDYVRIDFNGGEPLLNENFIFAFINHAKSINKAYNYSITTNGTLLSKKVISFIKENNINLQISLDGKQNDHDYNRKYVNGTGTFKTVMKKLNKIKAEALLNKLIISLVFTPKNVSTLSDNVLYILNQGFFNITLSLCADYTWESDDIKELKKQAHIIGDIFISYYEMGNPITLSLISNYIENTLLNFAKPICGAITDYIAILPNGDILPCGGFVGSYNEKEMTVGNIKSGIDKKSLEFYLDKKNEDSLDVNKDCKKCKLLSRCQHNCFAINNRINKDRKRTTLAGCIVNQIFILESDRVINKLIESKNRCFYNRYKESLQNLGEKFEDNK